VFKVFTEMQKFVVSHLERAPVDPTTARKKLRKLGFFFHPSDHIRLSESALKIHAQKKPRASGFGNDDEVHRWLSDIPYIVGPAPMGML
jgi:hypothetical protein